jgi:UDP-N-acetylmuramate dehydrogenase
MQKAIESRLQEGVSLAEHTTMKVGGRARFFAEGRTVEELRACLEWARSKGLRLQVLGGGSNTLFADEGYDGLVLKVAVQGLDCAARGDSVEVRAGAGQEWDELVAECVSRGFAGMECLSGIPGRVGATPIQNVGAYGQEIAETLVRVEALDRRTLEPVAFNGEECGFGYRRSRFKAADHDRYLVTAVQYRLRPEGRPDLRYAELRQYAEERLDLASLAPGRPALQAVRDAVLDLRRRKSMVLDPADPDSCSAGSFFLNPVLGPAELTRAQQRWRALARPGDMPVFQTPAGGKLSAAWLVEQSGFPKGYRWGRAGISSHHALALVNHSGTARQVLELADLVQQGVYDAFGVRLEREPAVVAYQ